MNKTKSDNVTLKLIYMMITRHNNQNILTKLRNVDFDSRTRPIQLCLASERREDK